MNIYRFKFSSKTSHTLSTNLSPASKHSPRQSTRIHASRSHACPSVILLPWNQVYVCQIDQSSYIPRKHMEDIHGHQLQGAEYWHSSAYTIEGCHVLISFMNQTSSDQKYDAGVITCTYNGVRREMGETMRCICATPSSVSTNSVACAHVERPHTNSHESLASRSKHWTAFMFQ